VYNATLRVRCSNGKSWYISIAAP
jgi:protein transport protein SEC24